MIIAAAIAIPLNNKKKNPKIKDNMQNEEEGQNKGEDQNDEEVPLDVNKNNYAKTKAYENFIIPPDGKLQVVGENFQQKNSTIIVGKNNKTFSIDDNGMIENITEDDFPLYYSFNEIITNGSYLFKDVKCFQMIDLSKMDGSEMIDVSNMFENSSFEEIYFGTENEPNRRYLEESQENEKRKEYFDTKNINRASEIFMNCHKLKKIQLPPSFNVGRNARGMFKGCSNLKEVNILLIVSTEIVEMESMFEDCESLREISFCNEFLTGEVRSLNRVFKNTQLTTLDISYLRLFNLETYSNIFSGSSINGNLKIGKYYSSDNIRDNLFREIAIITDPKTNVFAPNGTTINQIFENIYYQEKKIRIDVKVIYIDYNIHYQEYENYKLYLNYLHVGLGWDYDYNNIYDLDSSVVTFDSNFNYLNRVNFQQLTAYNGAMSLNGDDVTGEGGGDDEEIRISLDLLPPEVQIFTVQLNSYNGNSLKNVRSAYIRLSAQTEIIGTYSITQAGDNIGLLIGCFSKTESSSWYFRPLNRVIPGRVVTESVTSIQSILRSIFENN